MYSLKVSETHSASPTDSLAINGYGFISPSFSPFPPLSLPLSLSSLEPTLSLRPVLQTVDQCDLSYKLFFLSITVTITVIIIIFSVNSLCFSVAQQGRNSSSYTAWWLRHNGAQLAEGCYATVSRPGIEPPTTPSRVGCPHCVDFVEFTVVDEHVAVFCCTQRASATDCRTTGVHKVVTWFLHVRMILTPVPATKISAS